MFITSSPLDSRQAASRGLNASCPVTRVQVRLLAICPAAPTISGYKEANCVLKSSALFINENDTFRSDLVVNGHRDWPEKLVSTPISPGPQHVLKRRIG